MEYQNFKNSIDTNDFIECEFCKNKLFRKQIKVKLNSKENIFKMDYERCNCQEAVKYWEDFDKKKQELLEQEEKLNYIKEFNRKVDKLFSQSKIGYEMRNKSFDNFDVNSNTTDIIKDIKEYTKNIIIGNEKRGLIIIGKNGVGKTHIACSIANELIQCQIPVIYGTLINLLSEIKHSYDEESQFSEIQYIKMYSTVNMLIIDDLGKEKPSAWAMEKLFTIINNRYENGLPVIITTNYDQETLLERLSESGEIETAESIISRLYEMCIGVNIVDEDHRIKRKKLTNAGTIVN